MNEDHGAPGGVDEETQAADADSFAGGAVIGALMRKVDWAATPLGPVATWPQSLRTSLSICLSSRFPIVIFWGTELALLYNEAYVPILGQKHPGSLGQPGLVVWSEIREVIEPMLRGVLGRGEATWSEDLMLPIVRRGVPEESYFTFTCSPIRDESGGVGGVFCAVVETTERVLEERRLRLLNALAATTSNAPSVREACAHAAAQIARARQDAPFALLYLRDESSSTYELAGAANVEPGTAEAPRSIRDGERAPWPLRGNGRTIARLDAPVAGASEAVVLPIERVGFMVAGLSPLLAKSPSYERFHTLLAGSVSQAVGKALAYEEERRRAEALAELDRAKTAFFSDVSHEFRTPLTLMLGPLEDILAGRHGALADPVRADLEATQRNARRLLKLVNTLLDFSRIEAGRTQALYEPIELGSLTRELAGVFRSAIERAGLRFTVDCPPVSEAIYVDRDMWEKIVLNLLSNALKFTFEGEIAVCLRERGDVVELEVRDTGIGIAPAELPNLFKRFHRVEGAHARSHGGSGIGLALVQELVHLHGGEMAVESQPGRGSTFRATVRTGTAHLAAERIGGARKPASTAVEASTFVDEAPRWLPGRAATIDVVESAAGPAPDEGPAARSTAGARVLVADDNADMRDYLCRILGQSWRVHGVADGAAAVEAVRRDPPDIVITDVMMPAMDGFEVLKALRADARTRHVPIVMLSARAGEEARIGGLDAGADDYLIKPFSARELRARVGSQLALAAARRTVDHERATTLRSLFMQAPTPICILRGRELTVELANPFCCEIWGRDHQEVIGRPLFEAVPELQSQVFKQLLEQVLRTGEPSVGKETPATLGREGERRTIHVNFVYAPLRSSAGQVDGIMVIAFDVSDEVQARAQLARTVQYAEMFTGILAHDLRSPLGAVLTAAQLLLMRSSDQQIAKPASRILTSADRMSRMIDQLLDFTRLRVGGDMKIETRNADLAFLVRQAVDELQQASPGAVVAVNQKGDLAGRWDVDRLNQVFSNLIGNAIQHGARGGPVQVDVDGRAPDVVRMRVHNVGAIRAELLSKVFEPFKGGERHRERGGGLGLGLFITRELVRAHGGRVMVASTEAEGTTFTVELPRVAEPAASAADLLGDSRSRAASATGGPGAAEDLRQSEARFRLLVESVKDYAIFMLDPQGRVQTWNFGAKRIKGYEAREIIGQHFSRFYEEHEIRAGKCEMELEVAAREGRFEDEDGASARTAAGSGPTS